jgi:YhgE/Pip-like protein
VTQSPDTEIPSMPVSRLLRVPGVWIMPTVLASVLIAAITCAYFGSLINPTAHLHGLPVELVDQDRGATVSGRSVSFGQNVTAALTGTSAVSSRLSLRTTNLAGAEAAMDKGGAYAAIVIPSTFSASTVALLGAPLRPGTPAQATVQVLTNPRLGSLGVSLASGVASPALQEISAALGKQLAVQPAAATVTGPLARAQLAQPFAVTTSAYRPLPADTALGLSAFYLSLLTIMAGFLASVIVNTSLDSALGFAPTEVGVRWRQRRPVAISRRSTLLAKCAVAAAIAPVLTAIILVFAVGVLGMDAPNVGHLWLFMSVAAISIATGTLVLMAALGSLGQLLAMIIFIYLALSSSGGTVPLQAVPRFFQAIAHVEPLRQVLDGVRSIVYFDARADAGLTQSWIVLVVELVFWLALGLVVTTSYDRRGLYRMQPELLAYVNRSVEEYQHQHPDPAAHGIPGAKLTKGRSDGTFGLHPR